MKEAEMSTPLGRPGVTFAEVAAVADRIKARGERPTVQRVRGELGSGSLATLQRHFTAWREKNRTGAVESVTLPVELQRAMLGHIERAAAEARADLQAELAETQSEREALTEELERQGASLAAMEERASTQAGEIERQAGTIGTLERALAEAQEAASRERTTAETARKEAALAALRLESLPTLQADLAELRGKLDAERDARRLAEIAAAELRGQHSGKKG
jgi:colicin import membrane protein